MRIISNTPSTGRRNPHAHQGFGRVDWTESLRVFALAPPGLGAPGHREIPVPLAAPFERRAQRLPPSVPAGSGLAALAPEPLPWTR